MLQRWCSRYHSDSSVSFVTASRLTPATRTNMRGLQTCRQCMARYSTISSLANLPGPSRASIPRTAIQYPIQAQLRSYASRPPKDGAVDSQDAAAKTSTFIQEFNYEDADEGGGEDLRESFYLTDEELGDLTPAHRFGLDLPDPEELSHTASSSFSKAKGNRARSKRNLGDEFLGPTGRNPYPAKIELYRPEHDDKTELENTFRTRSERERDERGRISEAERAEFEAEHAGVSRAVGEGGAVGDETTEFQEWVDELNRRKRKAESKRRMGGFADHILVKVRGGKGGTGTASFGATRVGSLGPPTGGNGGPGGSVYLTTSPSLTSLHSLKRSAIGAIGYNGAGDLKHGSKGKDFILEVPIGTVITEIAREGSEEAIWHDQEAMNMPDEMRRKLRWERRFHVMSGAAAEEEYFIAGERALRKEKKWPTRTPTFEEVPPVILDIDKAIEEPILLARGGLGGMGNPFFHGLFGYKPPRLSSKGLLPYTSTYELELKMLADVGLVGFPNVGKSTILRGLTGRRAEVANYEFTTLNPQIGVVRVYDDGSFATSTTELDAGGDGTGEQGLVIEDTWREKKRDEEAKQRGEYLPLPRTGKSSNPKANLNSIELDQTTNSGRQRVDVAKMESYRFSISDNPGLLPQASENIGLGHSFLRSIERSLVLAYVLDIKKPDPAQDFLVLRAELNNYKKGLSEKGCVVILNKGDEVGEVEGREKLQAVKRALAETEGEGMASVQVLSGKFGLGLEKLVKVLGKQVLQARERVQRENEIKEAEAKEAAEAKWKKYNLKETSIDQEEPASSQAEQA